MKQRKPKQQPKAGRRAPRRRWRRTRFWFRRGRGVLDRLRLGTAGGSPWLRRVVLAAVLLGVAFLPYPTQGAAGLPPASACRSGCRAVPKMVRWTSPLPGSWDVVPGLAGTVPAAGLGYASVGGGVAVVGAGLTVAAYSERTGSPLWQVTLSGFPAGAAIVSVRAWPGEVTAGVSYRSAGRAQRTEVVIASGSGAQTGRYPAATFGGAVAGRQAYTVIVGPTAVTSYDNVTGRVRWQRPVGPVAQAWRTDGDWLYLTESAGGFVGSAPVTALRKVNMLTGGEVTVRPLEGRSFTGRLSTAFGGVVLFSSGTGVTAYSGITGERLWSAMGAVPEGTDPDDQRIYLTKGADLVGVSPLTGRVKGTVSGSAVSASAGVYVVRGGVALGLDQGGSGDAWGYDIAVQRVTLTAPGLSWPHYFVDLSGVGGSAEESGDLVIIAACAQVAATPPPTQTPQASPTPDDTPTQTTQATPTPEATEATPSPSAPAAQSCERPELVALGL